MTLVLMAVGLLVTAAGFLTIGFGIPINAFSLGNTLIISGTVATASGLILIGLAAVLSQLRRIAEALRSKAPVRAAEKAEVVTPAPRVSPEPAPIQPLPTPIQPPLPEPVAAEPPRAPEPRVPEQPFAPEPRFPATASEVSPGPLDWLRAKSKPVTTPVPPALVPPAMSEPPMVELTDEAPLSPRSPQRLSMPAALEAALDPKVWSPNRDGGSPEPRSAPQSAQPMARATPQVEAPREKERFDLVWPDRGAAPAPSEPKLEIKPEPKPEPVPEQREPVLEKREPALDMPLPPIPARPREARPASERRMPEILRKPIAERGPTILKSGVIDGMPYTLYADGSIEAQLPHGMVKFASVDALRSHLEKQS
jgi:hypothetical protein